MLFNGTTPINLISLKIGNWAWPTKKFARNLVFEILRPVYG